MIHHVFSNTVCPYSGGRRYYSLNDYCKDTFGEKTYRLSLSGGMSCPNRDGTLATGGCAFCSEGGSGDFAADAALSIPLQLADAKSRIAAKTDCNRFIAYFQSYTNTYAPVSYLKKLYAQAIAPDEIVALSIGTRSDCLDEDVLALLASLNRHKPVWIELGMQTMHNATLRKMHTHTTIEQFDQAVHALAALDIPVIAHIILGLPGEDHDMMLDTIRHVSRLPVAGVKLQLLHILDHTDLADMYRKEPFPVMGLDEYCDLVIDCLELLPPDTVIHRLTGDGPRSLLIAPLWSTDKKRVLNTIHRRMKERDTWQGKRFSPAARASNI